MSDAPVITEELLMKNKGELGGMHFEATHKLYDVDKEILELETQLAKKRFERTRIVAEIDSLNWRIHNMEWGYIQLLHGRDPK